MTDSSSGEHPAPASARNCRASERGVSLDDCKGHTHCGNSQLPTQPRGRTRGCDFLQGHSGLESPGDRCRVACPLLRVQLVTQKVRTRPCGSRAWRRLSVSARVAAVPGCSPTRHSGCFCEVRVLVVEKNALALGSGSSRLHSEMWVCPMPSVGGLTRRTGLTCPAQEGLCQQTTFGPKGQLLPRSPASWPICSWSGHRPVHQRLPVLSPFRAHA